MNQTVECPAGQSAESVCPPRRYVSRTHVRCNPSIPEICCITEYSCQNVATATLPQNTKR